MNEELYSRAAALFPNSSHNQSAWVRCILYLRGASARGWALDKWAVISRESSVLRGYTAPDRLTMPEMKTVVSLPEEQIVPPAGNVRMLRESK
jgi:hypothetical protein